MVKGVYISVVDRATNKNIDHFRINVDNAKKAKKLLILSMKINM